MNTETNVKIAIVLAVVGIDAVWMVLGGFSFFWPSAMAVALISPMLAGGWWYYSVVRGEANCAAACRESLFIVTFTGAGAMLSYLASSLAFPLIDDALASFDHAIGFDWFAYFAIFNRHEWLGNLSSFAYNTTLPMIALSIAILPLIGRADRAAELSLAAAIGALVAIFISAVLPSFGALNYYQPDPAFYLKNNPVTPLDGLSEFLSLRAGDFTTLSLTSAKGLIAFPSYHTVLGVLLILTFRGMGPLFYVVAAINGAMILSVPVDGAHHLADIPAGVVTALSVFYLTRVLRRWFAKIDAKRKGRAQPVSPEPQPAGA